MPSSPLLLRDFDVPLVRLSVADSCWTLRLYIYGSSSFPPEEDDRDLGFACRKSRALPSHGFLLYTTGPSASAIGNARSSASGCAMGGSSLACSITSSGHP